MFWVTTIRNLKNRVKELETINQKKQRIDDCALGRHEWDLSVYSANDPYVKCKHCNKAPEKLNGK